MLFQEEFYGHLDDPVYLLVWRDSEAKCFVVEESPPFDGDDEAKDAFLARWETEVNEEIAKKYPNVSESLLFPCAFRERFFYLGLHPQDPPQP